MSASFQDRIIGALAGVQNRRLGYSVIDADMIRDIATTIDGKIRVTLLMTAADDANLVKEVRQALEKVEGATDVRVDVKNAGEDRESAAAQSGIGKHDATPAANVAIALARQGKHVGLMDADIYGPNIPKMMGVHESPPVRNEKIVPLEAHGVKLISLGLLIDRDQPAIWRGPIIMKIVTQFLRDVDWGKLDYLIVDLPPGTGDAQLSLVQATLIAGAIIVTTPQDVSTGDALRGAKMFERVNIPVLGIIENMSYFICPHCDERTDLFGSGGGARLAEELGLPLLGEIPLYQPVMSGGDTGAPIVVAEPESIAGKTLLDLAARLAGIVEGKTSAAAPGKN